MNLFLLETTSLLLTASGMLACPPECSESEMLDKTKVIQLSQQPSANLLTTAPVMLGVVGQDGATVNRAEDANIVVNNDKGLFKIEIRNGKVTATKDGESIDGDRVKVEAESIIIYDTDGKKMLTVPGHGTVTVTHGGMTMKDNRPRIGIAMDPIDPALAQHLRIDNARAFIITEVMDGMPAAKAGLKQFDIVVRVNEQSASPELIQKVVTEGSEGQEVRLRVIRQGEPKEIVVKLQKAPAGTINLPSEHKDMMVWVESEAKAKADATADGEFDFDFDIQFDEDFDFDSEGLKKKIQEAMKDGRFEAIVGRLEKLEGLPQLQNLNELNELRLELNEIREVPQILMREFGPQSDVWAEVQESLEDTMQDIDPETRRKIEHAIKSALEKVGPALHGAWKDGRLPTTFELFKGDSGEEGVIVLHEKHPTHIRVKPKEGDESGYYEMQVEEVRETDSADTETDRIEALEARLERLEELLERIEQRLRHQ